MGLFDLLEDCCSVATAPLKIATSVVSAVVKPVAEVAEEIVEEVKDLLD